MVSKKLWQPLRVDSFQVRDLLPVIIIQKSIVTADVINSGHNRHGRKITTARRGGNASDHMLRREGICLYFIGFAVAKLSSFFSTGSIRAAKYILNIIASFPE